MHVVEDLLPCSAHVRLIRSFEGGPSGAEHLLAFWTPQDGPVLFAWCHLRGICVALICVRVLLSVKFLHIERAALATFVLLSASKGACCSFFLDAQVCEAEVVVRDSKV